MTKCLGMATSKLVKIVVLVVLLVAASCYLGNIGRQIGQLGDAIFVFTIDTLYPFLWLLLAVVLVAIAAGLLAALVRPLWICFIAFALASLAVLLFWGFHLIAILLSLLYLLAGTLYSRGVAKGLNERIRFSVRPIQDNQTALAIVLVIAACVLFYSGYAAQIDREGFTVPAGFIDAVAGITDDQIESIPGLTPQEREELSAELRQQVEQQLEDTIQPYQKLIPIVVALILLGLLTTIVRLFSWFPTLILKGVFAILTASHVVSVVTETREVERLIID